MTHNVYTKGLDNQRTTVVAATYIPDLAFEKTIVMDNRRVKFGDKVIDLPNYKGHFVAEFMAATMAVCAVEEGDEIVVYTNNTSCIQMHANNNQNEPYGFFINLLNAKARERNVKVRWIHILKGSNAFTRYVNDIAMKEMPYD